MTHHIPSRPCRIVAASLCAALLTLAAGFDARAEEGPDLAALDPGTIVSNRGEVFALAPSSVLESPPFHGTGVLPEGSYPTVVPDHHDAVPREIDSAGRLITEFPSPGARTESVIGTDERRQVTDTTVFPYRAIVWLLVEFSTGTYTCTGFFIDADTLATAGHCVYDPNLGEWATKIEAFPGRNGSDAPYGSALATNLFTTVGWADDIDHRFDYGAIKLDTPLGNTVGWLGYGVKLDDKLAGVRVRVFGYPGDKDSGTMWGTRRRIKGVEPQKIYYKIDTFGGQSGSPVYGRVSNTCQPCAFGIHAYGIGIEPYAESNSGTRVSQGVFDNLVYWSSQ